MRARTLFTVALIAVAAILATPAFADDKPYGEPLTGTDTVEIGHLLDHPDEYVGKTVRVEGSVSGVCQKAGCWMMLTSLTDESKQIRIKVKDGVIVFPTEAKGSHATAEGVFTKLDLDLEQTRTFLAHQAEEQGQAFDPTTVEEPMVYYQIKGTGAVIH